MIRRAKENETNIIDDLLTMLIHDERINYDDNINPSFKVNNWYSRYVNDESRILLVDVEDDKIVAFIYGYMVNEDSVILNKRAVLDALYVKEEYRNHGIASSLVKEFLKWSNEKNVKYIEVSVMAKNSVAKKLYKNNNFVENKEVLIYRS